MALSFGPLGRDHFLEQETLFRRTAAETIDQVLRERLIGMADQYARAAEAAADMNATAAQNASGRWHRNRVVGKRSTD